jgi:Protein of unknown function (DUF3703)
MYTHPYLAMTLANDRADRLRAAAPAYRHINGGHMNTEESNRQRLIMAWTEERHASTAAFRRHDLSMAWAHLERAHILSQPMAGRHVRTHLAMLRFAIRTLRPHEVVGQLLRTLVAAPGTWSGRYPHGNTGGADVSAFAPMTVPADLQRLLESDFEVSL